jgi:hypothetical protein
LLSITWFISIFTIGGKKRRGASAVGDMASSVASTATGGIVSAFKMFIYMNIVRVSMGDEKSSFKDTYEFMKTDIYKLLRVWIGSGLLISTVLFLGIIVLFALTKMGVIPVNDTSKAIIAPIFFGCVVFVFIFRAFSEQIGIFSVYIKDKYQKDII